MWTKCHLRKRCYLIFNTITLTFNLLKGKFSLFDQPTTKILLSTKCTREMRKLNINMFQAGNNRVDVVLMCTWSGLRPCIKRPILLEYSHSLHFAMRLAIEKINVVKTCKHNKDEREIVNGKTVWMKSKNHRGERHEGYMVKLFADQIS